MKITGIITTYNEEKHIVECIKSLEWCDEILVVDSFSTDKTVELSTGFENVIHFVYVAFYCSIIHSSGIHNLDFERNFVIIMCLNFLNY